MPEISIDRSVLRRILSAYFRLLAADAARVSVVNTARSTSPDDSDRAFRNLQGVMIFVEAHRAESKRQRGQNRHLEDFLLAALDGSDDDAFRRALYQKFPEHSHPEE
jgi:hypothetical protein